MVGFWQLLDQVSDVIHPLLVVRALWSREAAVKEYILHLPVQIAILWPKLGTTVVGRPLTYGVDKVREGSIGEERLGELPEEHLEGSSGDVDVLPLSVIQIHLLVYTGSR